MHNKSILMLLLTVTFLISCNKDDDGPAIPTYVGSFEVTTLRDECPDPSLNGSVAKEEMGVCLFVTDGQNCIDLSIILNQDMTFSLTTRITEIRGGIINSKAPATDTGSYEVNGNQLILNPQSLDPTEMSIGGNGTTIDWKVTTLSNGCDRIYGLVKT